MINSKRVSQFDDARLGPPLDRARERVFSYLYLPGYLDRALQDLRDFPALAAEQFFPNDAMKKAMKEKGPTRNCLVFYPLTHFVYKRAKLDAVKAVYLLFPDALLDFSNCIYCTPLYLACQSTVPDQVLEFLAEQCTERNLSLFRGYGTELISSYLQRGKENISQRVLQMLLDLAPNGVSESCFISAYQKQLGPEVLKLLEKNYYDKDFPFVFGERVGIAVPYVQSVEEAGLFSRVTTLVLEFPLITRPFRHIDGWEYLFSCLGRSPSLFELRIFFDEDSFHDKHDEEGQRLVKTLRTFLQKPRSLKELLLGRPDDRSDAIRPAPSIMRAICDSRHMLPAKLVLGQLRLDATTLRSLLVERSSLRSVSLEEVVVDGKWLPLSGDSISSQIEILKLCSIVFLDDSSDRTFGIPAYISRNILKELDCRGVIWEDVYGGEPEEQEDKYDNGLKFDLKDICKALRSNTSFTRVWFPKSMRLIQNTVGSTAVQNERSSIPENGRLRDDEDDWLSDDDECEEDDVLGNRIVYFTLLNRFGRGQIRNTIMSPHHFMDLLANVSEDKELAEDPFSHSYINKLAIFAANKFSVQYGLLRQNPSIWSTMTQT